MIEITPDLAKKLRFYDTADLNEIIKEHNSEKRQILEQNAALLSLLEETDSFDEEEVKMLYSYNQVSLVFPCHFQFGKGEKTNPGFMWKLILEICRLSCVSKKCELKLRKYATQMKWLRLLFLVFNKYL